MSRRCALANRDSLAGSVEAQGKFYGLRWVNITRKSAVPNEKQVLRGELDTRAWLVSGSAGQTREKRRGRARVVQGTGVNRRVL